ncbi:MAG: CBS domain-containing protein [Myxococcota bacterium]
MPKNMRVSEIMTRDPIVLSEEDNLAKIQEGMEHFHLRHIPVVDGERLVGIISQRDILRFAVSALERATAAHHREEWLEEHTFVAQVMTRDPFTVHPDTTVAEAAQVITDAKVGCLPVVEDDHRLVGIVTEADMLNLLVRMLLD